MACASSCKTKDHETYGQCLRSQSVAVMGLESTTGDFTATKKMHKANARYRAARAEGLQPDAPTNAAVDRALRQADITQSAPVAVD